MHISRPALRRSQVSMQFGEARYTGLGDRMLRQSQAKARLLCTMVGSAWDRQPWRMLLELLCRDHCAVSRCGTKSRGGCEVLPSGDRLGGLTGIHIHSHLPNGSAESQVAGSRS